MNKKCRQAEFITLLKYSSSIPAIYLLEEFIVTRTEDEAGVKTGDSNEKTDLDYIKKTRFNETRFSVVEGEKRVQMTR